MFITLAMACIACAHTLPRLILAPQPCYLETRMTYVLGGAQSILDYAGQDTTEVFNLVGHSKEAVTQMDKYQVGVIDADALAAISERSHRLMWRGVAELAASPVHDEPDILVLDFRFNKEEGVDRSDFVIQVVKHLG